MPRRSDFVSARFALAAGLAGVVASQTVVTGQVPELPLVFVRALDYNASLRWRETHEAACTRAALLPCSHACPLSLNMSVLASSPTAAAMYGNASATVWSASLASRIVASFPAVNASYSYSNSGACCGASIWCTGLTCTTHGEGSLSYVNNGWTLDDTLVPVYACMPAGLSPAIAAAQAPLAATAMVTSVNRIRIDGARFGTTAAALTAYTNGVQCTSVDVCSNVCSSCRTSSDCGDDKVCILISSFVGFCLRPCGSAADSNFCPCGATCVPVQGASAVVGYSNLCMNPNVYSVTDICAWGSWRPITPGLDSRIECTVGATVSTGSSSRYLQRVPSPLGRPLRDPTIRILPPPGQLHGPAAAPRVLQSGSYFLTTYSASLGYKYAGLCAADNSALQLGVAVVRSGWSSTGVDASLVPNATRSGGAFAALPYVGGIPSVNITWGDCTADYMCGVIDACTIPRCVPRAPNATVGCCVFFPTGRCTSDDKTPLTSTGPVSSTYIVLPSEVASVVPMPPVPVGAGSGAAADMSQRTPSQLPYGINWDATNVWYTPATGAFASNYSISPARYVDDVPLSGINLPFTFPFFGQNLNTLYLSANGILRIVNTPPCGSTFTGQGCTLLGSYDGGIMPLAADFNPRANNFAEIWVGVFDARSSAPGASIGIASPINASQAMCVTVMNVPLFMRVYDPTIPSNPAFNMHLCVFGDGGIRWRYGAIMNSAAFYPGKWDATSTVPLWGGPPNTTDWLVGVRALGSGLDTDQQLLTANYLYGSLNTAGVDTQTLRTSDVLLTRRGVRPGVVTLQWRVPSCGMGFDFVAHVAAAQDTSVPRVECVFGGIAVTARVQITNVTTQSYVTTCIAPVQTRAGLNGSLTVPVSLRLIAATTPGAYAASARSVYAPPNALGAGGIGSPAAYLNLTAGTVTIPLEVYGAFSTIVSMTSLRSTRALMTQFLTTQSLMFTYMPAGVSCGCSSMNASSTCDVCGVCGGNGIYRDCAGVCFGYAVYDDCGVCSGGTTGLPTNANQDCNGVCYGPGTGCASGPNAVQEQSAALNIIIIVALVTCSGALFFMLFYFVYVAIVRRRQQEIWLFEAALEEDPERPRGLAQSTIDAMPLLTFAGAAATNGGAVDLGGKKEVSDNNVSPSKATAVDAPPSAGGGEGGNAPAPAPAPTGESGNENTCSICLADYENGDQLRVMPTCRHRFHVDCIAHWFRDKTQCPVCRADLRTATETNAETEFRARLRARPAGFLINDRNAVRVGVLTATPPLLNAAIGPLVIPAPPAPAVDDDEFVDAVPRPGAAAAPAGSGGSNVLRAMNVTRNHARLAARGRGAAEAGNGPPRPPVVPRRATGGPLTSVPPPGMGLTDATGIELRAGPLRQPPGRTFL